MSTIPKLALIPSGVKASKVYSVLPTDGTGDFTFSRAGAATRVNSEGLIEEVLSNVPRLNYPMIDGVVSGCPSLLLEPQRTNIFTYSEDFSQGYWTKTASSTIISDTVISPKGLLNATKLQTNTSSAEHSVLSGNISIVNGMTYTVSLFAKAAEKTFLFIGWNSAGFGSPAPSFFDLTSGEYLSGTGQAITVTKFPNGWYKFTSTRTASATASSNTGIRIGLCDSLLTSTTTGQNTTDGIYIYGAQLEQGSYPTSYIPTNGSQVTRVQEICSQTPPSGIIGQTEGTFYVEFSRFGFDSSIDVAAIRFINSSSVEQIRLHFDQPLKTIRWRDALNGFANIGNAFTVVENVNVKVALKLDGSTLKFFANGLQIGSNYIAPNTFNMSKIELNNSAFKIEDFRVYNTALTDQELQQLTSL